MKKGDLMVAFLLPACRSPEASGQAHPAEAGGAQPRSRMVLMISLVEQPSSKFSTRTSPPLAVTSA